MNIENKIRFKAAGLYLIAGISAVAMVIFLYNVRSNINSQRIEAEKQHRVLIFTNDLIYAVGQAQASVSFFVSTRNEKYIKDFQVKLIYINSLIDTLSVTEPIEKENLQQIKVLLARQTSNILALNQLLDNENPVASINERIRSYKPKQNIISHIVAIKHDTTYKSSKEKKNFFRRLKDVFSPEKNTTMVVSNLRVDTIKVGNSAPSPFISEVKTLAVTASKRYEQNIRAIEQQVAAQIMSDREIAAQIAGLLLELHKQTLNSMLNSIERNEQSINRNYTLSVIGGIIALGLILLFILLIIYDVNKGKEAREKIRQVMESRHKLLLAVSHDIKSPLGSILGYLELRRKQGEDIKSMQNSARHILALLENLLEFSSLEQGSLQITSTTFSLEELSDEIGQMFLPLAEAKHISFSVSSDKIRIISDQMKMKQIIINLVSNAIKYTRIGEIKVATTYINQQLCIDVKDTGAGIPDDKLEEIYEPFSRVESNNTLAHGTGLGMYVVKGLVGLLQGNIHISSQVDKGTTVQIRIPCLKAESKIKQGTKKIAIHDDDPVVAEMARNMLTRLGHKIVDEDYDVILTDMDMGELSGNDILASAGNIPVIVMTGHSDFTIEKALQLGFAGFLQKPFNLESLREIFGGGESSNDSFLEEEDEEIMELFRTSTAENYAMLRQTLADADFNKAQATCHKMLPMFGFLGYPTDALLRMDAHRGNAYEGWEKDVETILTIKI